MSQNAFSGDILIVDDTPANLRLLKELLTGYGLKVRPTSSGELAIRAARLAPPDLILLDIRMPGLDGFEVCKQLKAIPETAAIPIIFISALGELHSRVRGFELGAVDYITKPFEQEEVVQRIRTHLELHKMRCSLQLMVKERTQLLDTTVQALKTLSEVNQALIRSISEEDLLQRICHATHDNKSFPLVWIGLNDKGTKNLSKISYMGGNTILLEKLIEYVEVSPTGIALTCGNTIQCPDINTCLGFAPIANQLLNEGLSSAIALPLICEGEALGVITIFSTSPEAITGDALILLQELADDLAFGIAHLRTLAKQQAVEKEHLIQAKQLNKALEQTVQAMARTVEKRDPYTAGHQARVAELAAAIGQELKVSEQVLEGLRMSAMIHDLGKIYVPAEILNRPGRLSKAEWLIISAHPQVGHDIVKDVDLPWPVAKVILQHHERMDGSGYPQGLKGDEILLEARIIAVADVLEAMSTHRPYRPAVGLDAALIELEKNSGKFYDPNVVIACINLFRNKGFTLSTPWREQQSETLV